VTDPQTTERVRRGVSSFLCDFGKLHSLSNLSRLLSNWSGAIEKRGKLSARHGTIKSDETPAAIDASLEVKDAGKLRRRNRPAQRARPIRDAF
jgi:hypothetical protein